MATSARIPPLIRDLIPSHHAAPGSAPSKTQSLTLLTTTLTTTANWLIVRYLANSVPASASASAPSRSSTADGAPGAGPAPAVILVSFLRSFSFWRNECKRATGVDMLRLGLHKKLIFVDAMGSFDTEAETGSQTLPPGHHQSDFVKTLANPTCHDLEKVVRDCIATLTGAGDGGSGREERATKNSSSSSLPPPNITLILDSPDLLLTLDPESAITHIPQQPRSQTLRKPLFPTIHSLRQHPAIKHTVISLSADAPFLIPPSPPSGTTPLDASTTTIASAPLSDLAVHQSTLLVQFAHVADVTISLRPLASGTAADVSGVGRVTFGGRARGRNGVFEGRKDGEWLYCVKDGDASAKVWER